MAELKGERPQPGYLMTLDELYRASVADLGPMDSRPYSEFFAETQRVGAEHQLSRPIMGIDISLKQVNPLGVKEMPYPISKPEWDGFITDSRTMATHMPHVHVIDGSIYTLPI